MALTNMEQSQFKFNPLNSDINVMTEMEQWQYTRYNDDDDDDDNTTLMMQDMYNRELNSSKPKLITKMSQSMFNHNQ